MKIILTKSISNVGNAGEIKEVTDGYARNFLIPQGYAKLATENAIKQAEKSKNKKAKSKENKMKKYKDLAKKINNQKITITTKADDKKTLFAAIKPETISAELIERNFDVPAQYVKLDEPIKQLGYYDIKIEFSPEITAKLGLTVKREE